MEIINAIAKARFASSQPQRVRLGRDSSLQSELICMEPGQELEVASGKWVYYVLKGDARVGTAESEANLSAGVLADFSAEQKHSITNTGEQRLICFAVGCEA